MPNSIGTRVSSIQSFTGCLTRIAWFFFGPLTLAFSLISIAKQGHVFSWADGLFVLALLVCLVSRTFDILLLNGETAYGEPATRAHLWRYLAATSSLAFFGWLAAHGVAYLRAFE